MHTKDFIKGIRELGYQIEIIDEGSDREIIYVLHNGEGYQFARSLGFVNTRRGQFFVAGEDENVDDMIIEYGTTPVQFREPEKKYVYRFQHEIGASKVPSISYYISRKKKSCGNKNRRLFLGGSSYDFIRRHELSLFTDSEVAELSDVDRALISVCEKIDVSKELEGRYNDEI